jgi:hypothetical protein
MKSYLAFALAAMAAALAPAVASAADQDPGARLGLPSIERAERYNLSPASRELRPTAVRTAPALNADYVTAANATSEQDAHDLDADSTSQRVKVGGVMVRQAGPDEPRAQFSYRMQAPAKGAVTLRIEEAGAEHSSYDVLVDGTLVHRRGDAPEQRGSYGGQVGLVHYEVTVPRSAIRGDTIRLAFRNGADPGPGARIAGVWVQSTGGTPQDPYGGTVQNAGALTAAKGAATLRGNLFGRPYVILDFGREVGGTLDVQAERLSSSPKLAFAFSESEQFMTSASDFSADPVGVVDETQVVPVPEGSSRVKAPQLRGGFRYLMVYLDGPGAVKLSDLRLRFTAAPEEQDLRAYKGAFLSSAADLNELWYAGAYTVQMSTIDPSTGRRYPAQPGPAYNDAKVADGPSAIVDAPKRDRFVWGGDLAVSDPVAYMTTGDTESAKAAFEWLSQKPSAEGQPAGVYLPLDGGNGWNYSWAEYAAWWMVNYQTHYLYTGDKAFLDRWFSQLEGAVGYFESHVGSDGLVDVPGAGGGHWGYFNAGKEAYDNVLYVYALERAARAAQAAGRDDLAGAWRAHADRTAAAVNDQLWDADAGAYRTGPGAATHPQDANAMAILAGVATGERADTVLRFLDGLVGSYGPLTVDKPGGPVPQYVSPFVSSFQLDALAAQADDARSEAAVALLRRTWSRMLHGDTTGTFLENVSTSGGPQLGSYTSYSHGWAAAPTSFLTNQVLGVQPTGAGFSSFAVLPHPGTSTDWAQGTVPTPRGAVKAAWRRKGSAFSLATDAPPGATYNAGVPDEPGVVVRRDGAVVWSDGKAQAPGVSSRSGYVQVEGITGATRLDAEEGSR